MGRSSEIWNEMEGMLEKISDHHELQVKRLQDFVAEVEKLLVTNDKLVEENKLLKAQNTELEREVYALRGI